MFAAKCEADGRSWTKLLCRVAFPLWVGNELLLHMKGFNYLEVKLSEGRMEWESHRWTEALFAVMRMLYLCVVLKMKQSLKAKLSIYRSIYVSTLTIALELLVMTKITRLQILVTTISFSSEGRLGSVWRLECTFVQENSQAVSLILLIKIHQERLFGHLFGSSLGVSDLSREDTLTPMHVWIFPNFLKTMCGAPDLNVIWTDAH